MLVSYLSIFHLSSRSSDIHSAFNILARKLMHDIQVEASFPPSTRADEICGLSRHLKYLMFDTGWLLLNALCTLSRQVWDQQVMKRICLSL